MNLRITLVACALSLFTAGLASADEVPVVADEAPVADPVESAPAAPAASLGAKGNAMGTLTIELEKVGLGSGRVGMPGSLRNRANEESTAHCPDNKCVNEANVLNELTTDFAAAAFLASRALMTSGMVVWLVSARSGTDRRMSVGPRVGGISLQATF